MRRGQAAALGVNLKADTAAWVKDAAACAGLSQSQWVARLIRERTRQEWPKSVKALAGAWPGHADGGGDPRRRRGRQRARGALMFVLDTDTLI